MISKLTSGETIKLAPGIRRIIAPNAGLMTGPGTNTYLLGEKQIAVVDPGPRIDSHIQKIMSEAGAPIKWIFATHTHPDHSPAVKFLAEKTDAKILGIPAPTGIHQDMTFIPHHQLTDAEIFTTEEFKLKALHTPGHASNHLCFLHQTYNWLLTGDHIINGSTVVINPPDGNMSDYISSLNRLKNETIEAILPGHGDLLKNPYEAIDWIINHRLERELKVIEALSDYPKMPISKLVAFVYKEIDQSLHDLAQRSLLAHLLKLKKEGSVICENENWELILK